MPSVKPDASDRDSEPFVELDPTRRYGRYSELLGCGAVKKVYRAFDQEEGIEVAWNQVKLRNFSDDPAMVERLYSEVRLLRSLTNKNIISLYSVWRDEKHNTLNFITEVCTSGNLREYRKKHRHVSMRALKKWSKQILEGLNYLHVHDPCIIHRDLNCSNVFVNGNTGQVTFFFPDHVSLTVKLKINQKTESNKNYEAFTKTVCSCYFGRNVKVFEVLVTTIVIFTDHIYPWFFIISRMLMKLITDMQNLGN